MEKINLKEILKDHVGEIFYSTMAGDVLLDCIYISDLYPIVLHHIDTDKFIRLDIYGRYVSSNDAECILFPSKDQRDWNVWIKQHRKMTYNDVAAELFDNRYYYFIDMLGNIGMNYTLPQSSNCASSEKQLEKLLAINKLMNVQKWIEKGWQPEWGNSSQHKHYIFVNEANQIRVSVDINNRNSICYFSTLSNAFKAIEILGEDIIRQAYSTDW